MKILDAKGRLFGKINVVDLLVLLLIIIVVAAVFWKISGGKITETLDNAKELPTIEYEVICPEVDSDVCQYAETLIGDQLMASGEMLNGEITAVSTEPCYIIGTDLSGNTATAEHPELNNLRVTIQCRTSPVNYAYAIGTQELRVGKSHIVKTVNLELIGTIVRMEEVANNG